MCLLWILGRVQSRLVVKHRRITHAKCQTPMVAACPDHRHPGHVPRPPGRRQRMPTWSRRLWVGRCPVPSQQRQSLPGRRPRPLLRQPPLPLPFPLCPMHQRQHEQRWYRLHRKWREFSRRWTPTTTRRSARSATARPASARRRSPRSSSKATSTTRPQHQATSKIRPQQGHQLLRTRQPLGAQCPRLMYPDTATELPTGHPMDTALRNGSLVVQRGPMVSRANIHTSVPSGS